MRRPTLLAALLSASLGACAADPPARAPAASPPPAAQAAALGAPGLAPGCAVDEAPSSAPTRTLFATRLIGEPAAPLPDRAVFRSTRPGHRIDLDLKDADISNVCRLLAEAGGVNIVLADDVQARVTMRLRSVAWDRALDAILRTKGFRAERDGNMILVFAK